MEFCNHYSRTVCLTITLAIKVIISKSRSGRNGAIPIFVEDYLTKQYQALMVNFSIPNQNTAKKTDATIV